MPKLFMCCKNCTERTQYCHTTCEKYKHDCELAQEFKDKIKSQEWARHYTNDQIVKSMGKDANRKKTRHGYRYYRSSK